MTRCKRLLFFIGLCLCVLLAYYHKSLITSYYYTTFPRGAQHGEPEQSTQNSEGQQNNTIDSCEEDDDVVIIERLASEHLAVLQKVNTLVTKFLLHQSYAEEIEFAQKLTFPPDIMQLIELLSEYQKRYASLDIRGKTRIFPKDEKGINGVVKNFVQINKTTDMEKQRLENHRKISKSIVKLQEYIHSSRFTEQNLLVGIADMKF